MNPTLKDIAALCGVDKSTVYRALSGKGRINEETGRRVREAAEKLGYSGNRAARRMAATRLNIPYLNNAVAILLPTDFYLYSYYQQIHGELLASLSQVRQDVLTAQLGEGNRRIPSAIMAGEVDAIICVGSTTTACFLEIGHSCKIPMVTLVASVPHHASVAADETHIGYLTARHLLELGHRRIMHFIPKKTFYPGPQRIAGFHRACREFGLKPGQVFLEICKSDPSVPHPQWLAGYLERALGLASAPTAFLASNDADARLIYDILQRKGARIPRDFSLIGCDNTVHISDARGENLLTTVDMDLRQMSREAATLALEMAKKPSRAITHLETPGRLIVRGSTATPL